VQTHHYSQDGHQDLQGRGRQLTRLRQSMPAMVCVGLIAAASEAAAQEEITPDMSANSMFFGCRAFAEGQMSVKSLSLANFCSGVVHGLAYLSNSLPPDFRSCVPETSNAQQKARVVVKYIEANPERMHEHFELLAVEAFHYAWPCSSDR